MIYTHVTLAIFLILGFEISGNESCLSFGWKKLYGSTVGAAHAIRKTLFESTIGLQSAINKKINTFIRSVPRIKKKINTFIRSEPIIKKVGEDNVKGSIQLGIRHFDQYLHGVNRLTDEDFRYTWVRNFKKEVDNESASSEGFPEFHFESFTPVALYHFRTIYDVNREFIPSICDNPLVRFENAGASGSIFYLSTDEVFIIKSLRHHEETFLQRRFLSGLTKTKDETLQFVIMNNLFTTEMKIHEIFDLKGSSFNRRADTEELKKLLPTFKDLDFDDKHEEGIFLDREIYDRVMPLIMNDSKFLEAQNVLDYSLLMGIHHVFKEAQEMSGNQSYINPSTTLDKCYANYMSKSRMAGNEFQKCGIPAKATNGDDLILFIGIIDILSNFHDFKKIEILLKSVLIEKMFSSILVTFLMMASCTIVNVCTFSQDAHIQIPSLSKTLTESFTAVQQMMSFHSPEELKQEQENQAKTVKESIQLGIRMAIEHFNQIPLKELTEEDYSYTHEWSLESKAKGREISKFTFTASAPNVFKSIRHLFKVDSNSFINSLCNYDLNGKANPGASKAVFFTTTDGKYFLKTVEPNELTALLILLPKYIIEYKKHQKTILSKFFGVFSYSSDLKKTSIVVMNNIFPTGISIDEKYDLKGSKYKRLASQEELSKTSPTLKDENFEGKYQRGLFIDHKAYEELTQTIDRESKVLLEDNNLIDYSLLLGIHNYDLEKFKEESKSDKETEKDPLLEKLKMLTKAIGCVLEYANLGPLPKAESRIYDTAVGIHARGSNGARLLVFVGIIDVLQDFNKKKEWEFRIKSKTQDKDVSVQPPDYYGKRFRNYMKETIFKISEEKEIELKEPLKTEVSFK